MNRFLRCAALLAGALLLTACYDPSVPQALASAPMPMDKAGTSVQLEFDVKPEHLATKRRLMVSVNFPKTSDFKLEDALHQKDMPVSVEVDHLHDGISTPVLVQDNAQILQPSLERSTPHTAMLNMYATDADTAYVLIGGFYPSQTGHYRAIVTIVRDQPLFAGVNTVVRIEPFYNTGE
jgi:hypothetical protein